MAVNAAPPGAASRRLRGAVLGVGSVARNAHVPGWLARPEVELVAAADVCPGGREAFLAAVPGARWYASAEELLRAEDLDFVDVCTPPATHGPLISLALGLSLDVLCEKPLVTREEELDVLADAAARAGRTLYTVHNWVHAPILARAISLVRDGAVGRVRHCIWRTLRSRPAVAVGNWRTSPELAGGGILVDHGWHAFYVVAALLGTDPESVRARLTNQLDPAAELEDTAEVEIVYRTGAAHVFLTWAADERRNLLEVSGTAGRLCLDGDALELTRVDAAAERWTFEKPLSEGSHHPDWFDGVARGFLREVADPGSRGKNLEEASLCLSLLSLARASSRVGGEWLPLRRRS